MARSRQATGGRSSRIGKTPLAVRACRTISSHEELRQCDAEPTGPQRTEVMIQRSHDARGGWNCPGIMRMCRAKPNVARREAMALLELGGDD